jgi:hypothetical protein
MLYQRRFCLLHLHHGPPLLGASRAALIFFNVNTNEQLQCFNKRTHASRRRGFLTGHIIKQILPNICENILAYVACSSVAHSSFSSPSCLHFDENEQKLREQSCGGVVSTRALSSPVNIAVKTLDHKNQSDGDSSANYRSPSRHVSIRCCLSRMRSATTITEARPTSSIRRRSVHTADERKGHPRAPSTAHARGRR